MIREYTGNWKVVGDRLRCVERGLRFGKSVRKGNNKNSMETVVV